MIWIWNDGIGEWTTEMLVKNATKRQYERFGKAQMRVFDKESFGWAHWSLKNARPHWSLEWMINNAYFKINIWFLLTIFLFLFISFRNLIFNNYLGLGLTSLQLSTLYHQLQNVPRPSISFHIPIKHFVSRLKFCKRKNLYRNCIAAITKITNRMLNNCII